MASYPSTSVDESLANLDSSTTAAPVSPQHGASGNFRGLDNLDEGSNSFATSHEHVPGNSCLDDPNDSGRSDVAHASSDPFERRALQSDELPQKHPSTSGSITSETSNDGFAEQDINAAIAASLGHDADLGQAPRSPKHFHDDSELPPKAAAPSLSGAARAARTRRINQFIGSEKSPLKSVDAVELLGDAEAWDSLTLEQRLEVLLAAGVLLPIATSLLSSAPSFARGIVHQDLADNGALTNAIAQWQGDLALGLGEKWAREEMMAAVEEQHLSPEDEDEGDSANPSVVEESEAWWREDQ